MRIVLRYISVLCGTDSDSLSGQGALTVANSIRREVVGVARFRSGANQAAISLALAWSRAAIWRTVNAHLTSTIIVAKVGNLE